MTVTASRVTVGTTATLVVQNSATGATRKTDSDWDAKSYTIDNVSDTPTIVYVGGSNVTTNNGFKINTNRWPMSADLEPGDALWMITESGTQDIHVLGVGR